MQVLCFSIYLVHWEVSTGNTVGAADFCRSVKCRGRIGRLWHGKLFTSATAPIGGITLVAVYSAWAAGTEDIYEIFHFYPLGDPCKLHGSLFTAATAPTGGRPYNIGGAVLAVGCWNGGHIRNFPLFTLSGTNCGNGSWSWGDPPTPSLVWW